MGVVVCHRKPVNVHAWQVPEFDITEWNKIAEWCGGKVIAGRNFPVETAPFILVGKYQRVPAFVGDWVIVDSTKECYPIPSLLFSQSYEIEEAEEPVRANWFPI